MQIFKLFIDIVGYVTSAILILSGIVYFIAWIKGIFTPVWRLGDGLAKRKLAIFAKGDNQESFKNLLLDSSLFNPKNLRSITKTEDFGRAETSTLYLVIWDDFGAEIDSILQTKSDHTALIVFTESQIDDTNKNKLKKYRNVTLVNFKGRLLNDILVSLMVTGYEKR